MVNRRNFIEKVGKTGLGVAVLALLKPSVVNAGVSDNSSVMDIIGYSDISNVGDGTITGAIGNDALLTNAQTLSGAVNEIRQNATDQISSKLNNCTMEYKDNHFFATYKAGTADAVSCRLDF